MSRPAFEVAIVGAGWAGLAAAVELADRGVPVTLYEASRTLGGRARSVAFEGTELDNGQHVLIGAYRETLALMRRVGAQPEALMLRLPLQLCFSDGFQFRAPRLPYPLNLLVGLLAARGLGLAEAFAAMRFLSRLKSLDFRVDPDRTVASLLQSHGQSGALRKFLWDPLCLSALNTSPERASAQVYAHVLRDGLTGARANSDLLLPSVALGKIFPEPAAKFVEQRNGAIELGTAIRNIARDADRFRLDDRTKRFDAVIVACAPHRACPLIEGFPELESARRAIDGLSYQPIYTCYLKFPARVQLPVPMLGFSGALVQWAFDRGQISGNHGVIAAVVSASGAHEALSQENFATAVHGELAKAIPNLPPPLWSRVIAEKRATFSCAPGLVRPPNASLVTGLLLAGDYTASDYPGTLEAAVRSGISAARIALAQRSRG